MTTTKKKIVRKKLTELQRSERGLRKWLKGIPVNRKNMFTIKSTLLMPFPCKWNKLVEKITEEALQ